MCCQWVPAAKVPWLQALTATFYNCSNEALTESKRLRLDLGLFNALNSAVLLIALLEALLVSERIALVG